MKQLMSEVEFYEGVLKEKPHHVDALKILGSLYTQNKQHEAGLMIDLRLQALLPEDETVHYNLACSFALLGRTSQALDTLRKAIILGYSDYRHMREDEDLAGLRDLDEFKEIVNWCKIASRRREGE